MDQGVINWFRVAYKKTVSSIAFFPAIIALLFLLLSFLIIEFDFSEAGKTLKSNVQWLSLKDASTARSICASIASGVISLTVFSFSMVMILLNQAASQMSNRILDKLIGNRFQQVVLGFYIGTIVYAFFLLSTIRDIDSGIYVPAISVYFLIILTIVDIFLFIYFLHYVTQTIKYETVIHKIFDNTKQVVKKKCLLKEPPELLTADLAGININAHKSGLYQGFNKESLLALCAKDDAVVVMLYPVGTFILSGIPFLSVIHKNKLSAEFEERLCMLVKIEREQDINSNYYYGCSQLMEIAVKALSPGINDPGTAIISLQALGDLLAYRLQYFPETHIKDKDGILRIVAREKTIEDILEGCFLPIWDYGKNDRLVQQEMVHVLTQLKTNGNHPAIDTLLKTVQSFALKQN